MSQRPRVTIGMPVRNGEPYLTAAIESILGQTYTDLALVISDNASTDETRRICEGYAAADPRVHYHHHAHNRGAARNYSELVALTESPYFKWAAHDDLLAPEFVERCVAVLDGAPDVTVCYSDTVIIDAEGAPTDVLDLRLEVTSDVRRQRYRAFHRSFAALHNFHCNPVFGLIRKSALETTALIGPHWGSDIVLLGELALHGPFAKIDEQLMFRREHDRRALRVNRSLEAITAWFDPDTRPRRCPRWGCVVDHLGALNRAPLKRGDRWACRLVVWRWAPWWRIIREMYRTVVGWVARRCGRWRRTGEPAAADRT